MLIPAFVAVVAVAPWVAYGFGMRALPADPTPADPAALPATAIELLWVDLRGRGEPALPRLNPFSYFRTTGTPGMLAAYQAGRLLLAEAGAQRSGLRGAIEGAAATIWISRHWTAREALATTLARHDFGHGRRGLDDAARSYFGAPPDALGPSELAQLVSVIRDPDRLDPWCHPQANAEAARALLGRAGREPALDVSRRAPPPAGSCG